MAEHLKFLLQPAFCVRSSLYSLGCMNHGCDGACSTVEFNAARLIFESEMGIAVPGI